MSELLIEVLFLKITIADLSDSVLSSIVTGVLHTIDGSFHKK